MTWGFSIGSGSATITHFVTFEEARKERNPYRLRANGLERGALTALQK